MAIIRNYSGSFGSRVSVIEAESFAVTISTAKEGIFKGLSTIILEGEPGLNLQAQRIPFAKIIYVKSIPKKYRQKFHHLFADTFNRFGETGMSLNDAVELSVANSESIVKEVLYQT